MLQTMKRPIDRVLEYLEEKGLAKTQVSLDAGFSKPFLDSIKNNEDRDFTGIQARKIAEVIGKSPKWVMFGSDGDYDQLIEAQFRVDPKLLEDAYELANRDVIKFRLDDEQDKSAFFKVLAYHIEVLFRQANNLPPMDEEKPRN